MNNWATSRAPCRQDADDARGWAPRACVHGIEAGAAEVGGRNLVVAVVWGLDLGDLQLFLGRDQGRQEPAIRPQTPQIPEPSPTTRVPGCVQVVPNLVRELLKPLNNNAESARTPDPTGHAGWLGREDKLVGTLGVASGRGWLTRGEEGLPSFSGAFDDR